MVVSGTPRHVSMLPAVTTWRPCSTCMNMDVLGIHWFVVTPPPMVTCGSCGTCMNTVAPGITTHVIAPLPMVILTSSSICMNMDVHVHVHDKIDPPGESRQVRSCNLLIWINCVVTSLISCSAGWIFLHSIRCHRSLPHGVVARGDTPCLELR